MPVRQTRTNGLVFRPFTHAELQELTEILDSDENNVVGKVLF